MQKSCFPPKTWITVRLPLLGLTAFVAASRMVFVTSSTNMWDSCSFVQLVRTLLHTGRIQVYLNLETGHPLYVQLCALTVWLSRMLGGPSHELWGMKVTGVLLVSLSVWPFFWLARWLFRDDRRGLLATAFYTLVPGLWWWSSELMSDAAGMVFLVGAFGLLARWLDGRSVLNLALACVLFGANPLVRFANLSALPFFVILVAWGLWQRRTWIPGLAVLLIPLPVLAASVIEFWIHPGRTWSDLLIMTPQNNLDWTRAMTARRWATILGLVAYTLSPVGMAATGLGLLAAARRRRRILAFVLLWSLPVVVVQAMLPVTMIRYWLPVVPVAAILIVALLDTLHRWPAGRTTAAVTGGAVAMALVLHALPVLQALHTRQNVLDAIPAWYRRHVAEDALLITGPEHHHVITFTSVRDVLFFRPGVYQEPWLHDHGKTLPETTWRIDQALAAGRPVYASDMRDWRHMKTLTGYYHFEQVAVLEGRRIRNVQDSGFSYLDERMLDRRDVHIYRLHRIEKWPRGAAPPSIHARSHDPATAITFSVDCPTGARGLCLGLISESAATLDWSHDSFGHDRVLLAGLPSFLQRIVSLDDRGRGTVTIEVPRLRLPDPPLPVAYVSYGVINNLGILSHIAVPVRVDLRGSESPARSPAVDPTGTR